MDRHNSRRSTNHDLYLIREDGTCERQVTSYPTDDLFPTWAPSGDTLAFAGTREGRQRLFLVDPDQGTETELPVGADLAATSPAWSRDGDWIAFEGRVPGIAGSNLYKVPVQGGPPTKLTTSVGKAVAGPAWAPDGARIYFVSDTTGRYELWSMSADGQDARQHTTGSGILGRPTVSPDGKVVVYARRAGSRSELAQVELASGTVSLFSAEEEAEPSFDPQGGRVAVSSWRYGTSEIVLLDYPSAANPMRVTAGPGVDGAPALRP